MSNISLIFIILNVILFSIFCCSDLGAHVEGFIAAVAHTVVVGSNKITGRQADALLAAHYASEAALRLMKPGTEV